MPPANDPTLVYYLVVGDVDISVINTASGLKFYGLPIIKY